MGGYLQSGNILPIFWFYTGEYSPPRLWPPARGVGVCLGFPRWCWRSCLPCFVRLFTPVVTGGWGGLGGAKLPHLAWHAPVSFGPPSSNTHYTWGGAACLRVPCFKDSDSFATMFYQDKILGQFDWPWPLMLPLTWNMKTWSWYLWTFP